MPAYEYVCKDCSREFTLFLSIREYEEKAEVQCPGCKSGNVQRKLTGFFAKTSRKS